MPDVEEQLRRYAAAAERAVVPAEVPVGYDGRRRHRVLAVAIAAAAAMVGLVLVVTREEDGSRVTTDPSTAPPSTTATSEESTPTTIAGTSTLRTFPVTAVTDDEYLVWAGEAGSEAARRGDGFAVDLASGAVRPIPPAPIDPRSGAAGVWTGEELIVCCGSGMADGLGPNTRSAAAWRPTTGEWRVLAPPPASIARSYPAAVWTGDLMVVVAQGSAAAAYDPDQDQWVEIAAPEIRGYTPEAAWTGDMVIAWDSVYGDGAYRSTDDGHRGTDDVADRGWMWTPGDDEWSPLPDLAAGHRTQLGSMAWTGAELVVWGQSTSEDALGVGARWRPGDDGWRPMRSHPAGAIIDPFNGTGGSQTLAATADGRVVVKDLGGGMLSNRVDLYDPRTDSWQPLDFTLDGFHPSITIAGDLVLVPDEARPVAGRLPG